MRRSELPTVIQAVGLACVPVHDMPPGQAALARRPVAAAVVTLQARADGHCEIIATMVADTDDAATPLPRLLDRALVGCAPTIITAEDCATLAIDAMARPHCVTPRLAALCAGEMAINPAMVSGTRMDEAALCRRLQIPTAMVSDTDVERSWTGQAPEAAMDVALGIAVARMMAWGHRQAFASGEPDALFETLLPLGAWMQGQAATWPSLHRAFRSRPITRAAAFAPAYRKYRAAREAGDPQADWGEVEDGLTYS